MVLPPLPPSSISSVKSSPEAQHNTDKGKNILNTPEVSTTATPSNPPYYLSLPAFVFHGNASRSNQSLHLLCSELGDAEFAITAIFWAATTAHRELVRTVLKNGFGYAVMTGITDQQKKFAKPRPTSRTIVQQAPVDNNYDLVQFVLGKSTALAIHQGHAVLQVPKRRRKWTTVLHWAVMKQDAVLLRHALEKGANVEQRDSEGATALHIAAMLNDSVSTRTLLEWEADVDAQDLKGVTPLQEARELVTGSKAVIWLLLENRTNINFVDESGVPLLHLAVKYDHQVLVKDLLDDGGEEGLRVDVNVRDLGGRTALHMAAMDFNQDACEFLVVKGADRTITDNSGKTASQMVPRTHGGSVLRGFLQRKIVKTLKRTRTYEA